MPQEQPPTYWVILVPKSNMIYPIKTKQKLKLQQKQKKIQKLIKEKNKQAETLRLTLNGIEKQQPTRAEKYLVFFLVFYELN